MNFSLVSKPMRRLAVTCTLAALVFSCQSNGCAGCETQEIPGGYPTGERIEGAMQIRLTENGLTFLEDNMEGLIGAISPTGMTFEIPPSGCNTTQKLCCGNATCNASMDIKSVKIDPIKPRSLKLDIDAQVSTSKLKFETQQIGIWFTCDIQYDSKDSSPTTLGLKSSIDISFNQNKTFKINQGATTISNFQCADVDLSGQWYCSVIDFLCPLLQGFIEDGVKGAVTGAVDDLLATLPTGQEGRFPLADLFASISPSTTGEMDYLLWGGGFADSENQGLSLGIFGGVKPVQHHACVPDCTLPGADCVAPSIPTINRSATFRNNTRPDGKAYHVGIGVDRQAIDSALYGFYSGGGLCLDIGTELVPQLSGATLGILIKSLGKLTGNEAVPVIMSMRPRKPPTITLGLGTSHTDGTGKVVIDDPLLTLTALDFHLDIHALIDGRYVRLFTVVTDLKIPLQLSADANGNLQPLLGDLKTAFENLTIENSELLSENPDDLALAFPALLELAGSFLGGSIPPITLPDIQGISIVLNDGSITSVDNKEVLAIFGELGFGSTVTTNGIETDASIDNFEMPATEAFSVSHNPRRENPPVVTLNLGATIPPTLRDLGERVEWSYRVNGGLYRPWTRQTRVAISEASFWLQGKHTIEVVSRIIGKPGTVDRSPVVIPVLIDTEPPQIKLIKTHKGYRAEVYDVVAKPEEIKLSWQVGDSPATLFGADTEILVASDVDVTLEVRDPAGNTAMTSTFAGNDSPEATGGCNLAANATPSIFWSLLLLVGVLVGRRRSNRRSSNRR